MQIKTEQITITTFSPDMAQTVYENSQDEDIRRFVPDEVYNSAEEAREAIEFLMSRYESTDGPFVYPIITNDSGKNIGYVQLCRLDDGKWEIGYHIAEKHTGKGYATEAVRAFLPRAAEEAGTGEIYGICLRENAASRRVLLKCGFVPEFEGTGEYQGEKRKIFRGIWRKTPEGNGP